MGATLRQIQPVLVSTNDPLQLRDTEERILAYFSRKLHGAETRDNAYNKELLAIKDALNGDIIY
jgi:hypothetical protein